MDALTKSISMVFWDQVLPHVVFSESDDYNIPEDLSCDGINETHSTRSPFIDSIQSSGKIPNRRHTHAHPGDDSVLSGGRLTQLFDVSCSTWGAGG